MLRTLAKWRISAAADRCQPLPPALRRRVDGDPELLAFESAARRLCDRLRRDSPAWLNQQADRRPLAAPHRLVKAHTASADRARPAVRQPARAALALAAGLAIALGLWRSAGELRYQHISAADRQQLVAALQLGRANLAQAAHAWRGVDAELAWPAWPPPPRFLPSEQVRASAGRLWSVFDQRVETRRQAIADRAKGAYDFFTVRLPASFGLLVGLSDRQPG
ncbi:MAG: hypothetical protein IT424_15305 [Pirellulales bacterium]|nr:hypothetical protein [Pirellulales bacterium]